MAKTPITVAHGDGIGPEIMAATLHILNEAGAQLDIEPSKLAEKVYLSRQFRRHLPGIQLKAFFVPRSS